MDTKTLRAVAGLARKRAERNNADHGDGMARLGARRALTQLASDLEVTATEFERQDRRRKRRSGDPSLPQA